MRLIDAECIWDHSICYDIECDKCSFADGEKCKLRQRIQNVCSVDAEIVRHGHWIEDVPVKNYPQFVNNKLVAAPARSFHCSRCKTVAYHVMRNFCSYCGAKMDEVSE